MPQNTVLGNALLLISLVIVKVDIKINASIDVPFRRMLLLHEGRLTQRRILYFQTCRHGTSDSVSEWILSGMRRFMPQKNSSKNRTADPGSTLNVLQLSLTVPIANISIRGFDVIGQLLHSELLAIIANSRKPMCNYAQAF